MYTLQNELLKIAVKKTGAELCKITSTKHETDFMWDGNPDVWSGIAPNLFPIIGALKNNTYGFEDKTYTLPKHGFIRNNENLEVVEQTENSLTFKLTYSEALLKVYPFKFEFYIRYTLTENTLEIKHTVKNMDDKPLYFSLGGHPAFKCPVFENETYEDYFLEFEHTENSETHAINMDNGLISAHTKPVFNNTNLLPLKHDLFNEDALVFKDLKSRSVSLKSKLKGEVLTVNYPNFPYLGIWAKPTGDYVCIEPWLGIADHENTNQDFISKEGILKLDPDKDFVATYNVAIGKSHLI